MYRDLGPKTIMIFQFKFELSTNDSCMINYCRHLQQINFSFVLSFGEFVSFFINEFLSKLLKTLRDHFEIYSVMLVKKISRIFLIKKRTIPGENDTIK